jgi:hypothetical protein
MGLEAQPIMVHSNQQTLGTPEHRPFCILVIGPTALLLQLEARPSSRRDRCVPTTMARASLCQPTLG